MSSAVTTVLARAMTPDLRLEAWFLWMMPLEAALSSRRQSMLSLGVSLNAVAGSDSLADRANGGLQLALTAWLRLRAFSAVMMRFF